MRLAALLALSLSLAAPVAAAPPTPPASIEQPPLVRRPAFPAEFPVGRIVDEKLVAGLRFAVPQPADALKMPVQEPTEISIMGDAAATEEQMLAYLLRPPQSSFTPTTKKPNARASAPTSRSHRRSRKRAFSHTAATSHGSRTTSADWAQRAAGLRVSPSPTSARVSARTSSTSSPTRAKTSRPSPSSTRATATSERTAPTSTDGSRAGRI